MTLEFIVEEEAEKVLSQKAPLVHAVVRDSVRKGATPDQIVIFFGKRYKIHPGHPFLNVVFLAATYLRHQIPSVDAKCMRCGEIHQEYKFTSKQLCLLLWCKNCGTQMHEPAVPADCKPSEDAVK